MSARVGILGYQGCIEPHERLFQTLGAETCRVRTWEELATVDRLVLPGGESSAMLRFITMHGLAQPLQEFAKIKPVWGICAGAILLAHDVHHPQQDSLKLINISAHRNFYGSQLNSFSSSLTIKGLADPITAKFIRAPLLSPAQGLTAPNVLACLDNQPVVFAQDTIWACSFHVELGDDTALHELFLRQ